jgi:UDP-N-acetylmuramate--alanine ligase
MELGIDFTIIKKALEKFIGVYRRFETKYKNDILVLDDYAHHPTETTVTLAGIRAAWDRRLIVVFQPHLYSRTKDFYQDFGKSFLNSDVFVCTDIYPAREKPIEGVSGEMISNITKKLGHKNVHYVADKNEIPNKLMQLKKKDDIIITMGAGDIWKYGEKFVELLKEEKR